MTEETKKEWSILTQLATAAIQGGIIKDYNQAILVNNALVYIQQKLEENDRKSNKQ